MSEGSRLLIVHGNGPQVGALAMAQEAVAREVPPQPLFVLGAMTQGQLGYLISQAVGDALVAADRAPAVAAVVTQVVVDREDPAFGNPTKPIGPFFSEGRARRIADARGWSVTEDSGRGWRRVVPSPIPREVVEAAEIRRLLDGGDVVIACGGGGVPVAREGAELVGVDAVIDKDFAASLIGRLVGATSLLLVTGVDQVLLDFGTPAQRAVADHDGGAGPRAPGRRPVPPGQHGPQDRGRGAVRARRPGAPRSSPRSTGWSRRSPAPRAPASPRDAPGARSSPGVPPPPPRCRRPPPGRARCWRTRRASATT